MFPALVKKRKELKAKVTGLEEYMGKAKVNNDYDPPNSELKVDSNQFSEKVREMSKEIEDLRGEVDELATVHQAEVDLKKYKGTNLEDDAEGLHDDPTSDAPETEVKSIGQHFIESNAYTDRVKGGQGPLSSVELQRKEVKTLFQTSAGWAPEATRTGIVTMSPQRPAPHVIDFIPQIPTAQHAVVYMEETTFDGGNVVEKGENVAFGEPVLALTERTATVRKIPVFLPVTDEQLEDIEGAAAYVDQRLRLMLWQRVDRQILRGNGTAPNLLGTESVAGIQSQALGNDSIPDAIYKMFVEIMADGYSDPDCLFIHPRKWRDVVLLKTADGQYIWGHPSMPGPMMLWGVPVKPTTAIAETVALGGEYQLHSFFALRRGIDMQITNSHGEYFAQGKQAIRMDLRAAMVHLRPKAFGEVTGL